MAQRHELLADPREVCEEHGARVEVVEREVAIGDRIERVSHRVLRCGQPQCRPGERACAERQLVRGGGSRPEASPVAVEHLDPGEQVVADRDGLGTLQVRVAGNQRVRFALGDVENRARELLDRLDRLA